MRKLQCYTSIRPSHFPILQQPNPLASDPTPTFNRSVSRSQIIRQKLTDGLVRQLLIVEVVYDVEQGPDERKITDETWTPIEWNVVGGMD